MGPAEGGTPAEPQSLGLERGSWAALAVLPRSPGQLVDAQFPLHSYTYGVLHSSVVELMASCVCRSLRLTDLEFMDGVGEAAVTASSVSLLLLCPCCYGVVFDVMVEQGGCVIQEYTQTVVCACDSRKMVYPVLGLWLEADSSGFLLRRRRHAGCQV